MRAPTRPCCSGAASDPSRYSRSFPQGRLASAAVRTSLFNGSALHSSMQSGCDAWDFGSDRYLDVCRANAVDRLVRRLVVEFEQIPCSCSTRAVLLVRILVIIEADKYRLGRHKCPSNSGRQQRSLVSDECREHSNL